MAAHCYAQSRLKFANTKRLTEIVVGPGIQRCNFVRLFGARREHNDRHLAPLAHFADKIEAVTVGQAEIKDNQIGFAGGGFDKPPL
ncbi:hypothetical protein D3C86_2038520 [compost metagenome]